MHWFKKKTTEKSKNYFKQAQGWADDVFGAVEQSRNRYQVAFFAAMGMNAMAAIAIASLANIQTLVPLLVHHYDNGVTTVDTPTQKLVPINKAQVENDLIRYLTHRESYDMSAYRSQFDLVTLLSSESVASEYLREQDKANKEAPIHQLGSQYSRQVHVYSINFIDGEFVNNDTLVKDHHNLAEMVFSLTDTDKTTGQHTEHQYNALISWRYATPSPSPEIRWQNWDGLVVTRYSKESRNLTK